MRQRLGVPANVAPNTRRTQFINHANYKIIYLNVIDWANATKIHTPPSAKHYFPPPLTSMRSAKTMSRPERARFRKALKTSHLSSSRMEMCCSCFMNTKYECLKCKIPICNQCPVFEENEDTLISELYAMPFFSAYFLQLIAKVRRREHYVPASRLQILALISSASGE